MKKDKVVFFDVDGTLIDCKNGISEPTDKTMTAIEGLRKNGYYIVIATGRPKPFLTDEIMKVNPDALVASNGSYIEIDKVEISNTIIETDILIEFERICESYNISYILECQDRCVYYNMNNKQVHEFMMQCSIKYGNLIKKDEPIKNFKCNNIVVFLESEEKYNIISKKFGKEFSLVKHNNLDSYDLFSNTFSKGSGVKMVLEYLNISKDNSIAFGDDLNDLQMFDEVGLSIAMGGCSKILLEKTNEKTDTVSNEGIYNKLLELKQI